MPKNKIRYSKKIVILIPQRTKIKSRSQATYDIKCSNEETKSIGKNPCKDHKGASLEAGTFNQVAISYMIHTLNLLDTQIENRQINGQLSTVHKPWISHSLLILLQLNYRN